MKGELIAIIVALLITAVTIVLAVRYMIADYKCQGTASTTWCTQRYWKE